MQKNKSFHFKQFSIRQESTAMKVGIDGILLGTWTRIQDVQSILDVGSGTGLLALMMAQRTNARIDAIEIDSSAYEEALYNLHQSPWESRIQLFHNSFREFSASHKPSYDLIICNPPFFKDGPETNSDKRMMARNEKHLPARELLTGAKKLLSSSGQLSFIYPFDRLEEILKLADIVSLYAHRICYVRSKPGKDFHRILLEMRNTPKPTETSELCIEEMEHHRYTKEFKNLCKDFYLNMES